MLSFTKGAESLSIFLDGVFHSIDKTHINYGVLDMELSKPRDERRLEMIRGCISIKEMIHTLTFGAVTISETEVLFEGTKIGGLLAERMLLDLGKGLDIAPYANFMNNVFANPATYTRDELHQWMKKARLPLTPDGCFLAFKIVRDNYMDHHSGRCDNTPGNTLEMDREKCNPDRHQTCSTGFHFASPGYFNTYYNGRKLVVKVNPRDITSIPSDYQYTKGRTCRYEVIAEIPNDKDRDPFWQTEVVDLSSPKTPDWIKFTAVNGRVIGADGDPSDAVIEAEEVAAAIEAESTDAGKATIVAATMGPGTINPAIFDMEPTTAPALPTIVREDNTLRVQYPDDDGLKDQVHPVEETATLGEVLNEAFGAAPTDPSLGAILHEAFPVSAVLKPGDAVLLIDQPNPRDNGIRVVGEEPAEPVFTTVDGREFSASVIKAAMEDASIRGAARNLGIGDSTLRGWLKKLG